MIIHLSGTFTHPGNEAPTGSVQSNKVFTDFEQAVSFLTSHGYSKQNAVATQCNVTPTGETNCTSKQL